MRVIRSETYSIFVGEDIFEEIQLYFKNPEIREEKPIIIVDENTKPKCLPLLKEKIPHLNKASVIEIQSGEENKNIQTCVEIWHYMLKLNATRKSVLINLGGGVITDMGGFVASTFKRGMRFINIPTSLLGQVDASIGGKVGVNLFGLKNQVGVFSHPEAVYIIPSFVNTLPEIEKLSGFAEMIKHGLIMDHKYWEMIQATNFREIQDWHDLIVRSVEIKNSVARNDPYEKSLRRRLNFGHTIGHAFESLSLFSDKKFSITHGEAIAMGMVCEAYLSNKIRGLSDYAMSEIVAFILANFKYRPLDKSKHKEIISIIRHDKKNRHNRINFTLIPSIGNALIDQWCDEEVILECLEYYSSLGTQ